MEQTLLNAIDCLCREKGEAEDVRLAQHLSVPLTQVRAAIKALEEAGLIEVEEFGFSCFAEYTVHRLTEQGKARLNQ